MSSQVGALSWNPLISNSFVSIGNSRLKTYKIDENKVLLDSFLNLPSNGTCCVWSPSYVNKLCVGTEHGSVYLIDTKEGVIQKEFISIKSEKARTRCVQWNRTNSNLIAQGLEKAKGSPGLMIWDINDSGIERNHNIRSTLSENSTNSSFRASTSGVSQHSGTIQIDGEISEIVKKPIFESLNNESIFSVAWVPNAPMSLLTGTYKFIRLVDIRDPNSRAKSSKSITNAHSKNVLGIEFNPFDHNYFASYGFEESHIKIWDIRNLSTHLLKREVSTSLQGNHKVVHMEWSPCEKNLLATLTSEGDCIKIWNSSINKKHTEKSLAYKFSSYRAIYNPVESPADHSDRESDNVKIFSLSHTRPHRILIGTHSNISFVKIESQATTFSVSPFCDRAISFEGSKLEIREASPSENGDISEMMQIRARRKIGMDFQYNLEITRDIGDKTTIPLWEWGTRLKKLNSLNGNTNEKDFVYVGVLSILNYDPTRKLQMPFLSTAKENMKLFRKESPFRIYTDDKRLVAMTLCWWEDDETQSRKAKQLSERDAAIAIFQFDLKLAGEILTKLDDGNNNYGMLAFAILGFSEERRDSFRNASASLSNPYLRAALRFLSSDGNDFLSILDEKNIRLSDRIAIACMYLSDERLLQYVKSEATSATKHGNLEGILLTGLNKNGLTLMQNFVNNTNDIQTACLAFSHVVPLQYDNIQVERWLQAYRDLLDAWQYWELRAMLDTSLTSFTKSTIQNKNPGVVIRCTYCSHALREGLQPKSFSRPGFPSRSTYNNVSPSTTSCPNCKKILPKCSICLTPYGISMLSLGEEYTRSQDPMEKLNYCFAWCRNCKHGGHVKHLMEWFSLHEECPVSGCTCCCNVGNPAFRPKE